MANQKLGFCELKIIALLNRIKKRKNVSPYVLGLPKLDAKGNNQNDKLIRDQSARARRPPAWSTGN